MRVDGRGVPCALDTPPQRVVSLVPSTTETLHALGLQHRIVGVTRFCVRPSPWVRSVAKVGGTKDVDPDRVRALRPDLIIANCEENTRELFDSLADVAPLWAAFPRTVDDALDDLLAMGELVHAPDAAGPWHQRIVAARQICAATRRQRGSFTYAWLIWNDPLMTVSDDTFVAAMMGEIGGKNVFSNHPDRFPTIGADAISQADPDVVVLSSEPFPFRDRHRDALVQTTGLPAGRFAYVDGQWGTWHGVRMAHALPGLAAARAAWSRET